jgi:hypothetical protein
MATSSFGFSTNYINPLLTETMAYRNFTIELLQDETFINANLGNGPLFGAGSMPVTTTVINVVSQSLVQAQYVYRGTLGSTYVYSIGIPPGGGATDVIIVGSV